MDAMTLYLHIVLAVAGMVAIACRLHRMSRGTQVAVRVQHALLFAGLLWSIVVPTRFAVLPVLVGVVAFLLLSASRWRHGAPEDTTRPGELVDSNLKHIAGGRKFDR